MRCGGLGEGLTSERTNELANKSTWYVGAGGRKGGAGDTSGGERGEKQILTYFTSIALFFV